MCGLCCGSVPIEQRGEAHKSCSEECYNAPSNRKLRAERDAARAERDELVRKFREMAEVWERRRDRAAEHRNDKRFSVRRLVYQTCAYEARALLPEEES